MGATKFTPFYPSAAVPGCFIFPPTGMLIFEEPEEFTLNPNNKDALTVSEQHTLFLRSQCKLYDPRRTMLEQVLISNLMQKHVSQNPIMVDMPCTFVPEPQPAKRKKRKPAKIKHASFDEPPDQAPNSQAREWMAPKRNAVYLGAGDGDWMSSEQQSAVAGPRLDSRFVEKATMNALVSPLARIVI